ncbi:MAG: hypothetical protein QF886_22330 [Planctomycetota bacterium]|jgi:hypothetical protein|nr:hypothetical protein [Planctomycetota bacterium]
MAETANIRSLEAIESFRSKLIVYLRQAENSVNEIEEEVRDVRQWLQHEGLVHWKREVQRRKRKLEDAKQLLMQARMSPMRDTTSSEKLAVDKAQRHFDEAAETLQALKAWNRKFDHEAAPLIKEAGKFSTTLSTEMPKAAAYLKAVVKTLGEYAETRLGDKPLDTAALDAKGAATGKETS